ncbi:MAG: hypothetical protein A2X34_00780 [Elusimicrobia bacterium GWC2_51_8]|nr:MAG: hypothetical protein A2X33_01780 [Elusimicrobia bacterium GWA2_51_34]OGR59228.1 MAG: hypothetical protein A2X34_00780 [Elusimicrobia bacterium GWC2_51_8]OGR88280.1 MAG: hypothetical protein A2021_00075 [Elusimicrobia bacterium GWF2_52_66]HAF94568.1 hypothetical protein [Elusimicrobiota bacterium]HCE97867.1 hypothetical protein [Elusimicrobiota bacterium]
MSVTDTLLKERARDCAPAFFLLLAVALSGLRNARDWAVFAPAFFFWAVFFRKEGFTLPGGLWPWFFGWLGIASVFSLEPLNSLAHFSKYLVFAFFLSLTAQSGENPRPAPPFGPFGKSAVRAWTRALFGAAFICASVIFYQRITGSGVYGIIGDNPNYSAAILAGAFAAAWVLAFSAADGAIGPRQASVSEKETRRKTLYGLFCAVFIAAIIAANSRGAMLASILAASAFLIVRKKRRQLLYTAAALALAAAVVPTDWLSFLFKAGDPRAYARVWIWGSAIEAALERPFFGFGPGLFERAFEFFKFPYFNGISYYGHGSTHAHSEILNLAAEAGLPAAALFTGAFFYSVKQKSRDAFQSAMKFCAIALFVQGAFDMVFYSGAVCLLFFGSLGFSVSGPRPDAAYGNAAGRFRPAFIALLLLCVLGLSARFVFERDYGLALRPGPGLPSADGLSTDPERSALALRRALAFAPYNKDLLLENVRRQLAGSGNYAYAAAYVENAAVFCPKDPRFPYIAAEAFVYGANAPEAYVRLKEAITLEPEFLAARFALTRLLYSEGNVKAASAQAVGLKRTKKASSSNARPGSVYDMLIVNSDFPSFGAIRLRRPEDRTIFESFKK